MKTMNTIINSIMKSYIKYICAVLMIIGTSASAWGAATTVTYTFNSSSWGATSGGDAANWTSNTDGSGFESTSPARGVANNGVDGSCTSPRTFYNVSSISIVASSNMDGTPDGKIAVTIGGTQIAVKTIAKSNDATYTYSSSDYASIASLSGYININVTKPTSKTVWVKSIAVTYTPATFTVTYNAQGGTCATSSATEASAEAGVTLPAATPSLACQYEDWAFYGWATAAKTSSPTTAPDIVGKAGDTYHPTSNITLHAVYFNAEYTKITSSEDIVAEKKYIIAANDGEKNYILKSSSSDYNTTNHTMAGVQIDETATGKYNATVINPSWCYTIEGTTDNYTIRDVVNVTKNYLDIAYTDWWGKAYDSDDPYIITVSGGVWNINCHYYYNSNYYDAYLGFDGTDEVFKSYSSTQAILLYKEITANYSSTPSCCMNIVELNSGTETHATIDDIDITELPTCSSNETNRQVTITVEPADHYEFTSSARLTFTRTSGSFDDPTYVSGPTDNGDGTYNFVYQFAQNASGEGTFSVEATPVMHTVSFNANGGSGSMASASVAYGSTYSLPAGTFVRPSGKVFSQWAEGSSSGTARAVEYSHTVTGDITFYAKWRDATFETYRFNCATLTLTPNLVTASTPIFITSVANKKVRSQDYIQITGSGLTPNTALSFPGLSSKFEVKTSTGGTIQTDGSGNIDVAAYIFYTPGSGDTSDGLDKLTGLTVSVPGSKKIKVSVTQDIIGRHLPAEFVIAGKYKGKWYALPATMESGDNPAPVEIAVDDNNNPSVAYTVASNKYGLEGPTAGNISGGNGQYVRLTLSAVTDGTDGAGPAPLHGNSSNAKIGKNGVAAATSDLSAGWWWKLQQVNTSASISYPQHAIYKVYCANSTKSLTIQNSPNLWGLYSTSSKDVDSLRLLPASSVERTESDVVAWGQRKLILEIDKPAAATQARAKISGGEWSANKSLATTTGTSVNGTATKYNYTLDFTSDGFDFSYTESEGKMLVVELLNSGGTALKASSVVIPRIVAANKTIKKASDTKTPWKTEVHVLPGVTLTLDASGYTPKNMTITELNVYPGATINVEKDTLVATTLILRNGWNRLGASKEYNVSRVYVKPGTGNGTLKATNVYADWYIDFDQYYPIAVPWNVTVSGITYKNSKASITVGASGRVRLQYYDGAGRVNGTNKDYGTNWKKYGADGCLPVPTTLLPSHGYTMTAQRPTGKAFAIVRMPLTLPSGTWAAGTWTTNGEQGVVSTVHKDTVFVTAHGVDDEPAKPLYAVGWNYIANPYMTNFNGKKEINFRGKLITDNGGSVKFATIYNVNNQEYDQVTLSGTGIASLPPSTGFLVQVGKSGGNLTYSLTFAQDSIIPLPAPTRYTNEQEAVSEQEAYIVLGNEAGSDQMGLIIGADYTEQYEINADLSKIFGEGNAVRTYMQYGGMEMAYVAINEQLAREWIPVTVRIPAEGEYTYSLQNSSTVDNLEGLYLIDYQTGVTTNLLFDDYTFTSVETGTVNGRFAINAIAGNHKVPTGADVTGLDTHSNEPIKFIWHDQVYILHRNVIYDSTGKRVNVISK